MSERDVYSVIERIIREGRRRINAADRAIVSQLLGAYQEARNTIAAELTLLEQQILWSIAENRDELTAAWVRRQSWYERLDETIRIESQRLEAATRGLTTSARSAGVAEGSVTGRATIRAVPWGGINPMAVETWTAAIQPGSPLDRVLARYGADTEESLRKQITQGIIEGRGSGNTVSAILADVGDAIPESRASRIVRTEMMRAYRASYEDQMKAMPSEAIAGYRWVSALDFRTCPICIGLHGQVFKEYPNYFHVQCRCTVSPVFSERYAPPREFVTGDDWFAGLGAEEQARILGPSRYQVFTEGVPLSRMVQFQDDPIWGGTSKLIPVRSLRP